MRRLIETRLARHRPSADPTRALLANVVGPVSPQLRSIIEAPGHEAAVLLGLVERTAGLTVLLTRRSGHLSRHAGQVSLPGGRIEHGDEDAVAAALREASEEVALGAEQVSVAGCLDTLVTGTGFVVTPVVGFIDAAFCPRANPDEVDSVFELPLELVLEPGHFELKLRERLGSRFRTYELRYGEHLIWGATAAMLMSLRELITDEKTNG